MKKVLLFSTLLILIASSVAVFLFRRSQTDYGWLVFGPEAELRVLVRLQGNNVSLDWDGNGEFSRPEEQFGGIGQCRDIVIADPDGHATYTITRLNLLDNKRPSPRRLMAKVHIQGPLEYHQYCDVELAASPHDAKEAHFHGPLTVEPTKILWELPRGVTLSKGDKPTALRVNVGTMSAEKGCWVVVSTQCDVGTHSNEMQPAFPKGVHPVVDVEFPPKISGAAPIQRRYPLDEPC